MRRLTEWRRTALAAAFLLPCCGVLACRDSESSAPPAPAAADSAATTSEAERTRELEAKAEGFKDRYEEIQASDMSPDQKAQAVGELVDEQQRAIQESEAGGEPADEGND